MLDRDPRNLDGAAGLFAGLSKYFGDADYSWFSRKEELDSILTRMYGIAAAIDTSIRPCRSGQHGAREESLM